MHAHVRRHVMNMSKQKAYAAAIAYASIIGFSFLFVKIALESANPIDLLAHRFTVSFAAALLLYPFLRKKYRISIQWRDLIYIVPFSLLYPVLFFAFQVWGLMYTSSSEAGIIQATIPILTILLAWFFKGTCDMDTSAVYLPFCVRGNASLCHERN